MSFFCQPSQVEDSRLAGMTITQSDAYDAAATALAFEVRAIEPAVLARLRVADDAGHAQRLITEGAGGSPLRCCLRASKPGGRIALVSYARLRHWAGGAVGEPS